MNKKLLIIFVLIIIFAAVNYLISSSSGKIGRTQIGCTCHGSLSAGNSAISLVSSPDIFSEGGYKALNSYTLSLNVTGGPAGNKGGFNLKASAGTLTNPGLNVQILSGEATHANPNSRTWTVDWVAPDASIDSVFFYFTGNAVNGNFTSSGDDPTPTQMKTATRQTTVVNNDYVANTQNFEVFQNYPNPFNSETKIFIQTNKPGAVKLKIFNMAGKEIFQATKNNMNSGNNYFEWNGKTSDGVAAVSGLYLYQVEFGNQIVSKKLILAK